MNAGLTELAWADPGIRAVRREFGLEHSADSDIGRIVDLAEPQKKDKALDLITGLGYVAISLAPHVKSVDAVDPDEGILTEAAENAAKANIDNIRFLAGDPTSIPSRDEEYEIVTARMALRHAANPGSCLKSIFRVLKPEGRLFIVDLLKPFQPDMASFFESFLKERDRTHVQCMNLEEWEGLLDKEGFDIDNLEVFPREYDFESWASGSDQDPDKARMLAAMLHGASPRAKRHFRVVEEGSRPLSFVVWVVLLRAYPRKSVST